MNNHHEIRENPNLPDEPLKAMWKLNLECLLPTKEISRIQILEKLNAAPCVWSTICQQSGLKAGWTWHLSFFLIFEIFQRIKSWRVISGIKDLQSWRHTSRSVWIDALKTEVFFKHLQQPKTFKHLQKPKTLQLIARKCLRVKIACLSGNSHCPLCGSAFYAVTANIPS